MSNHVKIIAFSLPLELSRQSFEAPGASPSVGRGSAFTALR